MHSIHILLVEDNEGDILLTTEALEEGSFCDNISVVKNGDDAIDFLKQVAPFESAQVPDLILLDINLPRRNGHEVLQYIKSDENLKQIPVVMLTTSSSEKDITASYRNHSNCYISKPLDADDFKDAIAKLESFWATTVQLPKQG
jgi:CheY-like chemotaxis protein